MIYLLVSMGAAELLMVLLAVVTGLPVPLLPVQLLWLNLVTNGIQGVALAFEPDEGDSLRRKPRPPGEPVFNRLMIERTIVAILVVGGGGFLVYDMALRCGFSVVEARNLLLLAMVLFENFHVGNCRSETRSAFALSPLRSPTLFFGTVGAFLIHIAACTCRSCRTCCRPSPWTSTAGASPSPSVCSSFRRWSFTRCGGRAGVVDGIVAGFSPRGRPPRTLLCCPDRDPTCLPSPRNFSSSPRLSPPPAHSWRGPPIRSPRSRVWDVCWSAVCCWRSDVTPGAFRGSGRGASGESRPCGWRPAGEQLMNLLILAMLDLGHRSGGKMLSRVAAGHALSGTLSIALTALAGTALLAAPRLPDWSLPGIGFWPAVIVVAYVLGIRMIYLDQRLSENVADDSPPRAGRTPSVETSQASLLRPGAIFAGAALVLLIAAPAWRMPADRLAALSGLGKTFVGTTLVACCTSLPELVASIAALRMNSIDLVVGNVFGSNAFNMVLFAPLDAVHPGSLFASVSPAHAVTGFAVIVATTVAILGQLYHIENRRRFCEPDALLLLLVLSSALFLV